MLTTGCICVQVVITDASVTGFRFGYVLDTANFLLNNTATISGGVLSSNTFGISVGGGVFADSSIRDLLVKGSNYTAVGKPGSGVRWGHLEQFNVKCPFNSTDPGSTSAACPLASGQDELRALWNRRSEPAAVVAEGERFSPRAYTAAFLERHAADIAAEYGAAAPAA